MDAFTVWYTALTLVVMACLALAALVAWLSGHGERAASLVVAILVVGFLPLILLWGLFRLLIPRRE